MGIMTVTVLRATRDLRIDGRAYTGCPILLIDGSIYFIPSRWLTSLWRTRTRDTAISYANQLRLFLAFLQDRETPWWEANADDVEALQTELLQASYKAASINAMVHAVRAFYTWAFQRGLSGEAPFVIRANNRSALKERTAVVRPILEAKRTPKYIGRDQFNAVLAHIPTQAPGLLLRAEVIFECGRYMGLRRQEVAGLRCSAFQEMDDEGVVGLVDLAPETTKGFKGRTVPIPTSLIRRIKRYIRIYRGPIVAEMRARSTKFIEPPHLFLTRTGGPISREYVSGIWNVSARAAGVKARFHSNRHWFGTVVVAAATKAGHPDPLRVAADMMGHSDISTTEIYAHAIALVEEDDPEAIQIVQRAWTYDR